MIGTEKQIAYAKDLIVKSREIFQKCMEEYKPRDKYFKNMLDALDFIEAVESGRYEEAVQIFNTRDIPGWVLGDNVVAARDDSKHGWNRNKDIERPEDMVVVAGNLIDNLKNYVMVYGHLICEDLNSGPEI